MLKPAQPDEIHQTTQLSRSTLLLRRLQASIQARAGKAPSYIDIEEWTGVAETTVKDWFNNKGRPTLDFALKMLERVPEEMRDETVGSMCKSLPLLEHRRLKCDQTVSSQLRTIVGNRNGFCFIQGESDEARTFLIGAMGNAFLALTERPRAVVGFDVHEADWFVPVPGVKYLGNQFQRELLRESVLQGWQKLGAGKSHLVVLNGIWSILPELQADILTLSTRYPVLVADTTGLNSSQQMRRLKVPSTVVSVSKDPQTEFGIVVTVHSL